MVSHIAERRIERTLVNLVTDLGGMALKLAPTTIGVPDRLVILPGGEIWFVELKAPGQSLSDSQEVVHRLLHRLGARVCVLASIEEVHRWASKVNHPTGRRDHE